ncbi:retrovirus-related pol polyprotein from transposon TNT 1-94 [Tanacetum coccineum]
MLAPKGSTFNGRPTFANPMYLKKDQSKNPCLYEIPYDTSDLANRFTPDRKETLTLEQESRSKLNKDLVKPYNYTKQNSFYENFKPPSWEYLDQLAHANEVRNKMWRKSFVKIKPHIVKNISFLPTGKSISKSRQAYNVMTNNINHFRELVDQAWGKNSHDKFRAPTAHDMNILIKTYLDAYNELQCIHVHKVKEYECLAEKLSKQTENVSKEVYNRFLRSFAKLEKHSISLELALQQCQEQLKNDTFFKENEITVFLKEHEQYFEIQDLKAQMQDKNIAIRVIHKTSVSRPQLKSTQMKDKVVQNNSQVKSKKTEVEDHHRISSISNKTKSVTACIDSLKSRTSNVNDVCATCEIYVFNSNHDACISKFLNDVNARTKKPKVVPINTRKAKSQANKSVATPPKKTIVQLILLIVDSGCIKHMTGNLKLLCNFVEKYMGTVRFRNDQFALILGYGDLVQGNIMINRVYYVEGLNHKLFSVGQFCDADLEVALWKSTCFVRDLQRNDLLTGNCGSDLYTISLQETTSSTLSCFMAKASPTQAWLWHRRLSHLNFDYINLLSKKDIVIGLPRLKYVKDQLCSCELSKAKRSSFKTKAVPSSKGWLNLLHMDLCGPTLVESINGKKYILTLHAYFKKEGIEHQTSTPRTPEQNGVIERQNRTLVEAARTMLLASKLPLFFWAEAIATACYT